MRIPDLSGNSWTTLPKSSVSFLWCEELAALSDIGSYLLPNTQHCLEKVFESSVTWVEKHKRGTQKSFCLYLWGIICLTGKFVQTYLSFTTVWPPANVHFDLSKTNFAQRWFKNRHLLTPCCISAHEQSKQLLKPRDQYFFDNLTSNNKNVTSGWHCKASWKDEDVEDGDRSLLTAFFS